MKEELLQYLREHQKLAAQNWLAELRADSLVRAALPHGALKPLVDEIFSRLLELIGTKNQHNSEFPGFAYIKDHHINGIDTLRGLQTVLLKGKRIFFDFMAHDVADRQQFIVFFQLTDDVFHRLHIDITTFYSQKSVSSTNNNHVIGDDSIDIHPSRLNLFYNAFQNSTDGIIITDVHGRIIEVNRAFIQIFGYSYEEVIGQTTALLRSGSTTNEFYAGMWETIKKVGSWKGEIVNRKKNGEEVPVLLSITPIYENKKIVGYMGVEIDTRRQKEMEERLLQSERFVVIGQMASKVAHEIRNPLSSISLNAELLEDEIDSADENVCRDAKPLLQSIMSEVDRLAVLTEEYLQFSRLPHMAPEDGDINKVISEVLDFFEAEANSIGIQIVTTVEKALPQFPFDPQQIRRLILNLLRNAAEAMPGGGAIHIRLRQVNEQVQLSVTDSGHGISEQQLNKIFEPFYTTKDMGTGLGLALCSQIVQEHGGRIWAESREKAGATFYVDFPIKSESTIKKNESEQV